VVSNSGPNVATGATVADTFPAALTVNTWTCTATAGSSCTATGSGNNRTGSVTLAIGGSATYTANTSLSGAATGTVSNTASVTPPAGFTDPNVANNNATDTDTVLLAANLSITKTDNVTGISAGGTVTYTIVVGNSGPNNVTGATMTDAFPAAISSAIWTCTASGGSSCGGSSGSGNMNRTINVQNGGTVTFTVNATLSPSASGSVANTATVAVPAGMFDPTPGNNSATDTDTVVGTLAFPTIGLLDSFTRANANNLNNGTNWSQTVIVGSAGVRVNSNQAYCTGALCLVQGWAMWNTPAGGFAAQQGTAFTFATPITNGTSLLLKGSGGTAENPQNYIRVEYQSGQVVISTTNNSGVAFLRRASIPATFTNGNTLTATAYANGNVYIYRNGTFAGVVTIPTSGPGAWTQGTSGGRIGILLPNGARVDDFRGATIP
jgi:uncharacterized repeat protein (TIGR01451 family)